MIGIHNLLFTSKFMPCHMSLRSLRMRREVISLQEMCVAAVAESKDFFSEHRLLFRMIPRPLVERLRDEAMEHLKAKKPVDPWLMEALACTGFITSFSHDIADFDLNHRLLASLVKCPRMEKLECTLIRPHSIIPLYTIELELLEVDPEDDKPVLRSLVWPLADYEQLEPLLFHLQALEELSLQQDRCTADGNDVNLIFNIVKKLPKLKLLNVEPLGSELGNLLVYGLRRLPHPRELLLASLCLNVSELMCDWPGGLGVRNLTLRGGMRQAELQKLQLFPSSTLEELTVQSWQDGATFLSILLLLGRHLHTLNIKNENSKPPEEEASDQLDLDEILALVPAVTAVSYWFSVKCSEPSLQQLLSIKFENFERFEIKGVDGTELAFLEAMLRRSERLRHLTVTSLEQLGLFVKVLGANPESCPDLRHLDMCVSEVEVVDHIVELFELLAPRSPPCCISFARSNYDMNQLIYCRFLASPSSGENLYPHNIEMRFHEDLICVSHADWALY